MVCLAIAARLLRGPWPGGAPHPVLGQNWHSNPASQAMRTRLRCNLPQPRGLRGLGHGLHARHGRGGRRRLGAAVAPPLRARAPAAVRPVRQQEVMRRAIMCRTGLRRKPWLPPLHDDSRPVSGPAGAPVAGTGAWTPMRIKAVAAAGARKGQRCLRRASAGQACLPATTIRPQ